MSWPSSSRPPTATTPSKRLFVQDGRRENNWSWNSRRVDLLASSSSPPRSSSPPYIPSSNRHSYGYAYIRSSPEIGPDSTFRGSSEHLEDPVFPWDRRHSSYGAIRPTASSYTAVSLKPTLPHPMDRLPSSDFEPSDYSEDFDHDPLDLDSEHTSDSAPPSSTPFSDSEEDDSPTQDDAGFEFNLSPCRRTFFRTSAERGQWKSDPFALKPGSAPSTWPTAPTLSRVPTPTVPASSRISIASLLQPEPACPLSQLSKPIRQPQPTASSSLHRADTSESEVVPTPSDSQVELSTSSPHTLPSLTSDRESSPDVEDDHASPLSPLPPSSPPLSPVSVALSYHSDPLDLSCLSSPMSSPVLRSSSPLSELSLDEDDETTHQAKFTLEKQLGAHDDSDDLTLMDTDDHADTESKATMSRSAEDEAKGRMTLSKMALNQRKKPDPSRGPSSDTCHQEKAGSSSPSSLLSSVSERKAEVITDVKTGPCDASISERARDGQASRPVGASAGLGPGPAGLSTAASSASDSASKSISSHSFLKDSTTRPSQIPISSLLSPTPASTSFSASSSGRQQQASTSTLCAKPEPGTEAESQRQTLSDGDGDGLPDRKSNKSRRRHEAVGSASLKKLLIDDGALDDDVDDCQRDGNGVVGCGSDGGMEIAVAVAVSGPTLGRDDSCTTTTPATATPSRSSGSGLDPCLAEDGDGDVVMMDGEGTVPVPVEGGAITCTGSVSALGVSNLVGGGVATSTPASSGSVVQAQAEVPVQAAQQQQLRDKNGVERVGSRKSSAAAASSGAVVEDEDEAMVLVAPAAACKSDMSGGSVSGSGKRKETSEGSGAPVKKRRKVGSSSVVEEVVASSSSSSSRQAKEAKKEKVEEGENDLPVQKKQKKPRKKRTVEEVDGAGAGAGPSSEEAASKAGEDGRGGEPAEEAVPTKPKKGGKRGRRAVAPPVAEPETDNEGGDSHSSSACPKTSSSSSSDEPLDAATAAMHAEVCGLLIETLALSRASSMPVSLILKTLMRNHPTLEGQRSEKEWMGVVRRVLRDGEAGRGSGVFGKVESSGKDDADRPLEAHWFYVPELDTDQDRATLIKSMMPRPAKRSTTKKYKQYYWRPLDKISKWDPEDEL